MHSPRYNRLQDPGDPEDADDERSLSDAEAPDAHAHARRGSTSHHLRRQTPTPQFPGQDVRPTSRKELLGWYSYAWAAEVFAVCGMGSFIPVTLEQLARENGVLLSDETKPCVGGPPDEGIEAMAGGQCIVYVMGWRMNTSSFAMYGPLLVTAAIATNVNVASRYSFSISVLLQALIIVSMSGAADHGTRSLAAL